MIRHGDETILVVEDQKEVRGLMTVALRAYGYRVLEAAGGAEALEIFASHDGQVDLLLTDMVMPGMNGTDLARRLVERKADLKILYVSGYSEDLAERRCELGPGSSYLPKPFTPDVLAAKVREVLG
jgi:CheY-like chemotaxis protein